MAWVSETGGLSVMSRHVSLNVSVAIEVLLLCSDFA